MYDVPILILFAVWIVWLMWFVYRELVRRGDDA